MGHGQTPGSWNGSGVPALVVPRVRPSAEQLVRANDLVAAGLAAMIHPDEITPPLMREAIIATSHRERRPVDHADYCGAEGLASLLMSLVGVADELAPCVA